MPARVCLATLVLVAAAADARANLRAPKRTDHQPSSALLGLDPSFVVRGERLSFACEPASCQVTARYAIDAAQAAQATLQFLLPTQPSGGKVIVRADSATTEAAVRPAELAPAQRARLSHLRAGEPLFAASFPVAFSAGRNEIAIDYRQPLGAQEQGHGYFTDGAMLRRWDYELWPVSEWKRAADFAIEVSVTVPRKPPSLWQRWFGTVESVACDSFGGGGETARKGASAKQVEQRLEYQTRFQGESLPERLRCAWGDEDQLPR